MFDNLDVSDVWKTSMYRYIVDVFSSSTQRALFREPPPLTWIKMDLWVNLCVDLWVKILQYLPITDQLSLAQVNDSIKEYVKYYWRHSKIVTLADDVVGLFTANEPSMLQGLQCWSGSSTKWTTIWRKPDTPHLTHPTLTISTTSCDLWRWKLVKELRLLKELIPCENLGTDIFKEIFGTLQLTKLTLLYFYCCSAILCKRVLTELQIDDHYLGFYFSQILERPSFRRLSFYARDYYESLLGTVAENEPLKVRSLLFFNAFWNNERVAEAIRSMKNLRKLVLYHDYIVPVLLRTICQELPHLEELHLISMIKVPASMQLWVILRACPSLRVVNLSSSFMSYRMIGNCTRWAMLHRDAPLTLYLHDTSLNPVEFELDSNDMDQPNCKISFEPIEMHIKQSSPRFVEIEFIPDSEN